MGAGSAICCGHAVLSLFNCLMWVGSAIYCGQSWLRLPYGRWQFSILWPVLSSFNCLTWVGSAIYCGQSWLRLPYGRWQCNILWPVLSSFNCLMGAGSAIYRGQSCRLIVLCGSAVQYTLASPVVVCHRGWRCSAHRQYRQVWVWGARPPLLTCLPVRNFCQAIPVIYSACAWSSTTIGQLFTWKVLVRKLAAGLIVQIGTQC